MPKALLTDIAALIGAHLARELADRGDQRVALDDLSRAFRDNVDFRASFARKNLPRSWRS